MIHVGTAFRGKVRVSGVVNAPSTPPSTDSDLLLESGDHVLLESGDKIILES